MADIGNDLDQIFLPLAQELLAQYGQPAVYMVEKAGDYNPATAMQENDQKRFPINIVFVKLGRYDVDDQSGSNIVRKRRAYCAGADMTVVPLPGHSLITKDGQTYSVTTVSPTFSGRLVALWEFYLDAY